MGILRTTTALHQAIRQGIPLFPSDFGGVPPWIVIHNASLCNCRTKEIRSALLPTIRTISNGPTGNTRFTTPINGLYLWSAYLISEIYLLTLTPIMSLYR